jgi:predicted nuclease of predicted toxin-antitoxin system
VAAIKLDENVPDSAGVILRESGHDVALARDEQLAGVVYDRVLSVASAEGRVLVTLDQDFTNILRHPPEQTAGIVVIRLHSQTLQAVRQIAATLGDLLAREPTRGRLWVVDESRVRLWPR